MSNFQLQFEFPLVNGLHARPASFLREKLSKFKSTARFCNLRNNIDANAKSVVELMSSDTMHKDKCIITITGEDANEAYLYLSEYLKNEFLFVDDVKTQAKVIKNNNLEPDKNDLSVIKVPRLLRDLTKQIFYGVSVVSGINHAKIFLVNCDAWSVIYKMSKNAVVSDNESQILTRAIDNIKQQIHLQINQIKSDDSKNQPNTEVKQDLQSILFAHLSILDDESFISGIMDELLSLQDEKANDFDVLSQKNCATALYVNYEKLKNKLSVSQNAYLRERVIDIEDVTIRIINEIYGNVINVELNLTKPSIIVANELTPSQFLSLDKSMLKGLVLKSASSTSHIAILARSFGIPMISNLGNGLNFDDFGQNNEQQYAVIDANRGLLIMSPTQQVIDYYQIELEQQNYVMEKNLCYATKKAITLDGKQIEIVANVASSDEISKVMSIGADGVGLFRSEFLFMGQDKSPSEEEQYVAYSKAIIDANGAPVVVRLLDVGGDKPLNYINLGKEENPFLGYRAVRFYKEYIDIFHAQLRALLRAGAHGNIKIMVPMISNVEEMDWVKNEFLTVANTLKMEGFSFKSNLDIGAMIEVPSTVFMLDELSKVSDFFSIGTNDLCQYFFACERGNNKVSELANPLNPAFLRFLRKIVSKCNMLDKFTAMCGELAGNIDCMPLLIGLGLDELSMSGSLIAEAKSNVLKLDYKECKLLLNKACELSRAEDVLQLLRQFTVKTNLPLITDSLIKLDESTETLATQNSKVLAIKKMVSLLKQEDRIVNADAIEDALWQREDTYATGIGYGIAIPHCKVNNGASSSICVLRFKEGMDWGSVDGGVVNLMLGIVICNDEQSEVDLHLKIIAKLSRQLMKEDFRLGLFTLKTNKEISELILSVISDL